MPKYTKRSDGRYVASITMNGKKKYIYARSQKELDIKLTETKSLCYKGISLSNETMTIKKLSDMWFDLIQKKNTPATQKRNRGILDNYICPQLGHIPLKDIKSYHIQNLINSQLETGKTDTVRKTLQIIKSILNLAVDNDFIVKNVANPVKMPTFRRKDKKILSKEERAIIENSNNKYRDFFTFLLYTGLRKGEIAALTWDNIDFDKNLITVKNSASFITNQGTIKSTKNGDERIIPMLDKTRKILERRSHNSKSKYIFYKQNLDMLSDIAIKRMLESFKKDTGLEFTLHQLRHTFCTMLYYSGISSKKAQQIMGHRSLQVTLEIYTHLDEQQENNSAELLNKYLTIF